MNKSICVRYGEVRLTLSNIYFSVTRWSLNNGLELRQEYFQRKTENALMRDKYGYVTFLLIHTRVLYCRIGRKIIV